ncbi:MAG: hypothetical protein Q8R69_23015 [Telluria sp.]|nr:hypothetical protein [Telluria sp.]
MFKPGLPTRHARCIALAALIAGSAALPGCRSEPGEAPNSAPAAASAGTVAPAARSKQQAMAALMALPELKAWSSQLEKQSGGKVHGALIEYDPAPKLINGKSYWQFSFVENGSDAAHRWESFLVAEQGDEILVEDADTDAVLSLDQWRKDKQPMARTGAPASGA